MNTAESTHKVNCPTVGNCIHGSISKCDADKDFSDHISFTDEINRPTCPRYQMKKKEK